VNDVRFLTRVTGVCIFLITLIDPGDLLSSGLSMTPFPEVKMLEFEADHSPQLISDIRITWSYASTTHHLHL
jgi:hypothetical protein